MTQDQPISWLMFFTLAAGVVIIGGAFLVFLRSRSNRAIAADALEGHGRGRGLAADGALPDLAGVVLFAFIAMGLLALGFNSKPATETAQLPGPVGSTRSTPATPVAGNRTGVTTGANAGANTGMAQPPGIQNEPKQYQPVNPAPDTRAAPTGSNTGIGASPGSTGTVTK